MSQQAAKPGSLIDRLQKKLGIKTKREREAAANERLLIRKVPKMPPGKWKEMEG